MVEMIDGKIRGSPKAFKLYKVNLNNAVQWI